MINQINNGDSASEIRAKLNEMISIVNDYSSSQYISNPDPGAGGGAEPGGAGGDNGSDYQITIYVNMTPPPLSVDSDASMACNSINMGYQSSVYISKSPSNMGGTQVPEVGDTLYQYYPYSGPLTNGYVGYKDSMMMNYYIEINMNGEIITVNSCA